MGFGKTITVVLAILTVLGATGYVTNEKFAWWDNIFGSESQCDKETCGDGVCAAGCETSANCVADCFDVCSVATCGDGVCAQSCETTTSCPADCIVAATCGDGICASGETSATCPGDCTVVLGNVPVENLSGQLKNEFTMATVTNGVFKFYTPGADVSNPYVHDLDVLNVSIGSSANMVIQTGTAYDIYYEADGGTYYDEKIDNWQINYNPETGKGHLMIGDAPYLGVKPVGAFVSVDTLPEVQVGMYDNGTNHLDYNSTLLGGSGWFKMDIGNSNANSVLKDVVMCFRDNDGDMEGNEITAFTASYVSGSTAIQIPGDLQQYWEDAMGGSGAQCFDIASELGGSQKARWQFSMTVEEANFAADSEEFEMTFDDLGGYLAKQYPSRSVKATAVSLTIGTTV
jgi:hypothetical protein